MSISLAALVTVFWAVAAPPVVDDGDGWHSQTFSGGVTYRVDATARLCFVEVKTGVHDISCTGLGRRPEWAKVINRFSVRSASQSSSAVEVPAEWIKKVNENSYEVCEQLELMGETGDRLARSARVVPSFKDGQPNGFKLFAIRPGSLLARLGLQNGDVVKAVNGAPLTSPDTALQIYAANRNQRSIRVSARRRGSPLELSYRVVKCAARAQ